MTIPDEALRAADNAIADAVGHTSSISTVMLASAALTAALPFLQGVKVKALNWVKPPLSETLSRCETEFGTYRTWTHDEANGKWFWSVEGGYNEVGGSAKDEASAKAAAQADYSSRILSAIEPAPSPRDELLKQIREGTAPGFINDGSNQEGNPDLDCPYCGGSGHKADVRSSPRAQALGEGVVNCAKNLLCSLDPENDLDNPEKFIAWHNLDDAIRALSSQPVADGCKGEWFEIEYNHALKGRRVNPAYFPSTGEVCEISGPNCDDDKGYTWGETTVLWQNETFVLYGKAGCWPVLHKHEHVLFRPLPASPGASATRPTGGSDADA